jgi:CHASE3 domain sensor protein
MNQFLSDHTNQTEALASIADSLAAISTGIVTIAGCVVILTLVHLVTKIYSYD